MKLQKIAILSLGLAFTLFCGEVPAQAARYQSNANNPPPPSSRSRLPKGWTFAGNATQYYSTWTDIAQGLPIGTRCSIISLKGYLPDVDQVVPGEWSPQDVPSSRFATVMQAISAENYRGKRVRFSAQLASDKVSRQAALWMRIDGQNGKILNFDDMAARPIVGSTSWNRYEIVLDVPPESVTIQFGYLLAGEGSVRAAQFAFDTVDGSTPLTAAGFPAASENLPKTPINLGLHLELSLSR